MKHAAQGTIRALSFFVAALFPISTFAANLPVASTLPDLNQVGPYSVDGGHVVYRQANGDAFGATIRAYDPATGNTSIIASGKWYTDPIIVGNRVVWYESTGACPIVTNQLCTPQNARWDLVSYNTANQSTQVIARDLATHSTPLITSNLIVWDKFGTAGDDVFSFDFSTGQMLHVIAQPTSTTTDSPTTSTDTSSTGSTNTSGDQSFPTASTSFLVESAPDTDGDLIPDQSEITLFHTNANRIDTDGDGLSDYEEAYHFKTDPTTADTDGDGISDGREVVNGTNPNVTGTTFFSFYEWSAEAHSYMQIQ